MFDDKIHYILNGDKKAANPLPNKSKAMVEKLINISETQEQTLKSLAQTLSVSEEELIQKVLTEFLNSPNIKIQPSRSSEIEKFLHRAQEISEQHHLPSEYRFNRDELYEE